MLCLFAGLALQAQDVDLSGTWTMYEMIWSSGAEDNTTTEEQLKDEGMMTEYSFTKDGKVKLVSNMTGSERTDEMEGTWKLEEDKLTFSLQIEGNQVDIVWDFEFKDDKMHLTRSSPDGSMSVVNSFKRK